MIEDIVIAYLNADATLDSLLSVSGSDTKIYPIQKRQGTSAPFITYKVTNDGSLEENIKEITMIFDCIGGSYSLVNTIRNRVSDLLDRQDDIHTLITDAGYNFYWCKKISGNDSLDAVQKLYHKELYFSFKYAPKTLP